MTASVFDMLHSLDDWQDHGTCDVYFAACGLVPTRMAMQDNAKVKAKHSLAAKTVAAEKKDAKQMQSSRERRLVPISTRDFGLSTQRQQKALLIENHLKIRNKAVAQQQQPAVYTQIDKHRLLDLRFAYCLWKLE